MLFVSIKTATRWSWFRKVTEIVELAIVDENAVQVQNTFGAKIIKLVQPNIQEILHKQDVVFVNGLNKYFDQFQLQWFPCDVPPIPIDSETTCLEQAKMAARSYLAIRRSKLDHYMRAIVGFKSSHLIGLINARCADFIKQYNDHILSTASMNFDTNGNVVVAFNRQQYEFMMGFGRGQSEEHIEFCKNATKGIVEQLLAIP